MQNIKKPKFTSQSYSKHDEFRETLDVVDMWKTLGNVKVWQVCVSTNRRGGNNAQWDKRQISNWILLQPNWSGCTVPLYIYCLSFSLSVTTTLFSCPPVPLSPQMCSSQRMAQELSEPTVGVIKSASSLWGSGFLLNQHWADADSRVEGRWRNGLVGESQLSPLILCPSTALESTCHWLCWAPVPRQPPALLMTPPCWRKESRQGPVGQEAHPGLSRVGNTRPQSLACPSGWATSRRTSKSIWRKDIMT